MKHCHGWPGWFLWDVTQSMTSKIFFEGVKGRWHINNSDTLTCKRPGNFPNSGSTTMITICMGCVRSNRKIEKKNRGCWLSWNDCCQCKVACWHERNANFYPDLVLSKQRSCRPKSRSILQVNLDGDKKKNERAKYMYTRDTRRTRYASAFLRVSWKRVYFSGSLSVSRHWRLAT